MTNTINIQKQKKMSPFICFMKKDSARTGNILFQYLMCKLITLICDCDHIHIPIEETSSGQYNPKICTIIISETTFDPKNKCDLVETIQKNCNGKNTICDGYFQDSRYFVPFREELLKLLYSESTKKDHWIGCSGYLEYISSFLYSSSLLNLNGAVIISLRLDDFIQYPCKTSDIISPQYYTKILDTYLSYNGEGYCGENISHYRGLSQEHGRIPLFIVCDTIRHDWEREYLKFFDKWDYQLIQSGDLLHDCAIFRDCSFLIHSNSSLCWMMSFLSRRENKQRFIPRTGFYKEQYLGIISDYRYDTLITLSPLTHDNVLNLNINIQNNTTENHPIPLSYCIPDECIIPTKEFLMLDKKYTVAPLIPGNTTTYIYETEDEYYNMYKSSVFAHTSKKGGWDCLRHYEILANGCIPVFNDENGCHLKDCPDMTLTRFPKQQLQYQIQPFAKTLIEEMEKLLEFMRNTCSTSATAKYFMENMGYTNISENVNLHLQPPNILLIRGNCGVNYTRETLWIGLHRLITEIGGIATEYPQMDYMYDDYTGDVSALYGKGMTYSRRLTEREEPMNKKEIIDKIQSRFWDIIIYGKVGIDEGYEGSIPTMPLWNYVYQHYDKNKITFLYGGDGCQNMKTQNSYSEHLLYHMNFAKCFVRELDC